MIKGIGVDIIELSRIKETIQNNKKFIERILCESEKNQFKKLSEKRKVEFLAGRFAAKEAFSKAFGTGIGKDLSFQDIEIGTDKNGKPIILKPKTISHVSISHSKEYAVAQVVIERDE
jgi:holo-[acyl-carrier protein] synthase